MKNVCIVLRGELLRNPKSHYHTNVKNKNLRNYDVSKESFNRQDTIMISIIRHVIIPYEKLGYNVFVSGTVYECPEYNENLNKFFPKNTIKQIQPGKTNQAEMFNLSIDNAEKEHPNCSEYISMRTDYLMLRNANRKNIDGLYIGYGWVNNKGIPPEVDLFYIISKSAMKIFKMILHFIGKNKEYTHTHHINLHLKNVNIATYPIWDDYENKPSGISYKDYVENIKLHENRPFVNYMRNLDN